jgi:DNA-directed RNA polymerase specialized sigma24 family protein
MPSGSVVSDSPAKIFVRLSEKTIQAGIQGQQPLKPMSDTEAVSGTRPQDPEHLAPEEVLKALEVFSAEDKLRLKLIERRRRSGTDFGEGELYHEALCLTLIGRRKCPIDVPLIAFLAKTMQNLAYHRRAKLKRERKNAKSNAEDIQDLQVLTDQHNPELSLIEQEDTNTVTAIYGCLDGDEEAQFVVMALADGKRGKELRDEIGIDQAAYDYAMRRIKKAVKKRFPEGLPS